MKQRTTNLKNIQATPTAQLLFPFKKKYILRAFFKYVTSVIFFIAPEWIETGNYFRYHFNEPKLVCWMMRTSDSLILISPADTEATYKHVGETVIGCLVSTTSLLLLF